MWSGFSSEIETGNYQATYSGSDEVACGAASHLRLKRLQQELLYGVGLRRMWSGFSSEIETLLWYPRSTHRYESHVERLLI